MKQIQQPARTPSYEHARASTTGKKSPTPLNEGVLKHVSGGAKPPTTTGLPNGGW